MRFAAPWIVAFACAMPALAPADELTPEKQADIRQLIGVTGAKLPAQLADATAGSMTRMLRQARPDFPDRFYVVLHRELVNLFAERMDAPGGLVERLSAVYDKQLTHPEVKQLLAFYETPLGRKSIEIMPMIMNESTAWGHSLAPEIQKRLQAEFKKEELRTPRKK